MESRKVVDLIKKNGTGIAIILFPLVFAFAFAVHPGLASPHLLNPLELIFRAHQNPVLQFGHVLVTLNTALLVVVALHFLKLLDRNSSALAGFIGASLAILGAIFLAADKGAFCLTMSAFDTLSPNEFTQILPGVLAIFNKEGWMVLTWGMVFLPVGFGIQAIAMIKARALPYWQSIMFLIGVVFIATPDGLEIINLFASILMAIALVPYGIRLLAKKVEVKGE
jgi:hypothetical protein